MNSMNYMEENNTESQECGKINKFHNSNISGREWGDRKEFATDVARYHSKNKVWQEV